MKESVMKKLVTANRTCRRFVQNESIDRSVLRDLVDLARLSASGGNSQPLKYILSCTAELNALIFPSLAWAGFLKEWSGPAEGERPEAYIVILGDSEISRQFGCDHGIAAQSIMLGATELGLAGCMMGSIDRKQLREDLKIEERYKILLVLALGKPGEKIHLENVKNGDIKYWRDEAGVHHVPKRALDEIIL